MIVWSALDGSPPIRLSIVASDDAPFAASVTAAHRAMVGRVLATDETPPFAWHYELSLHDRTSEDGWLPTAAAIDGRVTVGEVGALLAVVDESDAERLELSIARNRGGDGLFAASITAEVIFYLIGIVGTVETLRLPALFAWLVRMNHRVPMADFQAYARTGELSDEARRWTREEYGWWMDSYVALTGLSIESAREALRASGFSYNDPSGAMWQRRDEA